MNHSQILLDFIASHDGCTQEYLLLKYLESEWPLFFNELDEPCSLYQKHFLLFYRLYLLDSELIDKNLQLIIAPLEIRLVTKKSTPSDKLVCESDALREFYSDKRNLQLTEEEVAAMQRKFWDKYLAIDQKAQAIKLLGLSNVIDLEWPLVKQRYKKLARKHHPDKGGDPAIFIELREAYEQLRRLLN